MGCGGSGVQSAVSPPSGKASSHYCNEELQLKKQPIDASKSRRVSVDASKSLRGHKYESNRENIHTQYLLLGKLGKGAFAQVQLARQIATGEMVAVKITDLRKKVSNKDEVDSKALQAVANEVEVLQQLGELPHCVRYIDYFFEGWLSYVVMERCNQTLLLALDRHHDLTEQTMIHFFMQMLEALSAIHNLGIVHRDVKPDNFLVCDGHIVKLCDFGLAKVLTDGNLRLQGVYGTAPFMSPEMLGPRGYGTKTDVWSLGVCAYVLLLGQFPYQPAENNAKAMKVAIVSGMPEPAFRVRLSLQPAGSVPISSNGIAFLKSMLERNPTRRLDSSEAKQKLSLAYNGDQVGSASLKPMLYAAKRCGAFDTRHVSDDENAGSVDRFLREQQTKIHGPASTVTCVTASSKTRERPLSRSSTSGSGKLARGADVSMIYTQSTGTGGDGSQSEISFGMQAPGSS